MKEEGTALQKVGKIPIKSLVLIHLDTNLKQSSAAQGRV